MRGTPPRELGLTHLRGHQSPDVLAGLGAGPPSSEEDQGDAEAAGVPGECDGECQPLLPAVHVFPTYCSSVVGWKLKHQIYQNRV